MVRIFDSRRMEKNEALWNNQHTPSFDTIFWLYPFQKYSKSESIDGRSMVSKQPENKTDDKSCCCCFDNHPSQKRKKKIQGFPRTITFPQTKIPYTSTVCTAKIESSQTTMKIKPIGSDRVRVLAVMKAILMHLSSSHSSLHNQKICRALFFFFHTHTHTHSII